MNLHMDAPYCLKDRNPDGDSWESLKTKVALLAL